MQNLIQLTDDQLVALYSNGNTKAFDTLLSRYQDKLYSYIKFVVRNRDLADDIFQDTFVKALVTLQKGSYPSTGKFGAWLTRIAHNLIIDYFRQDKNENTVSNDAQEYDLLNDASLAEANVEDTMINEQTLRDVRRLVDALPDNQREVVFHALLSGSQLQGDSRYHRRFHQYCTGSHALCPHQHPQDVGG